jgi:hypothetical protein
MVQNIQWYYLTTYREQPPTYEGYYLSEINTSTIASKKKEGKAEGSNIFLGFNGLCLGSLLMREILLQRHIVVRESW